MNLHKKEQIEIDWWRDSKFEGPNHFSKQNISNKLQESMHFDYKIRKHFDYIKNKKDVLEIGAGQGWASCYLMKNYLPEAQITVTDISPHAVASVKYWEDHFKVKMKAAFEAKSYEIDAPDQSYDLIFCYAAAHHFIEHNKTLIELHRVLKSDGHILYLYEPVSSRLFYKLHYWYVNKAKHSTPEDVLIPNQIKKLAINNGLQYEVVHDQHQTIKRSKTVYFYFGLLSRLKFLQTWLPGSADFVFRRI